MRPRTLPPASARRAEAKAAEALVDLDALDDQLRQLCVSCVDHPHLQNLARARGLAQRARDKTVDILRMLRVAPAALRPGDEEVASLLLPAWYSTIGPAPVRTVDLRAQHADTALAKFLQKFDARVEGDEARASLHLGLIVGRLAGGHHTVAGLAVHRRGSIGNVAVWECSPLHGAGDELTPP